MQDISSVGTRRGWWQRLWRLSLIFILILLGAIFGTGVWLRTASGSEFVLTHARLFLTEHENVEITWESARFDFFTGLHLHHLHVRHPTQEGKNAVSSALDLDLNLENLDLDYRVDVFSQTLILDRVRFERPQIKLHARQQTAAPSTPPEPETASKRQEASQSLDGWLKRSPVTFDLRSFALIDGDLDFERVDQTGASLAIRLPRLNFESKFYLTSGRIESSGLIAMPVPLTVTANEGTFNMTFNSNWQLSMRWDGRRWVYEVQPSQYAMKLTDLVWTKAEVSQTTRASLGRFESGGDFRLFATTDRLFAFSAAAIETHQFHASLHVSQVAVEKNGGKQGGQRLKLSAEHTLINSNRIGDEIQSEVAADIAGLQFSTGSGSQMMRKPVRVDLKLQSHFPTDLKSGEIEGQIGIEHKTLVHVAAKVQFADPDLIDLTAALQMTVDPILDELFPHVDLLRENRGLKIGAEIQGNAQVGNNGPVRRLETISAQYQVDVPPIQLPQLSGKLSLTSTGKIEWQSKVSELKLDLNERIKGTGKDNIYGDWKLRHQLIIAFDRASPAKISSEHGVTEVQCLSNPASGAHVPVLVRAPVEIKHDLSLGHGADIVAFEVKAPWLEKAGVVSLHDLILTANIRGSDLRAHPKAFRIETELKQGRVDLAESRGENAANPLALASRSIKEAYSSIKAESFENGKFELTQFKVGANDGEFGFDAQGEGFLASQDAQIHTQTTLALKEPLSINGQVLSGLVTMPMDVTIFQGREISAEGQIDFRNMGWRKAGLSISGLTGKVPIRERLTWKDKHVKFRNLVAQSPFERVDFSGVQPFLLSADQLKIERIGWEERSYGPLIGYVSLEQNMLALEQFDFDLNAGRIYGEMFLDFSPSNLRFGLLSRVTGMNLTEVLPHRFLARLGQGTEHVSGRSGFVLNLNRGLLEGRVDVTEIGGSQLRAFINVMDPDYSDKKMNQMRTLLKLGYPTAVAMAFKDGYMDMDVDLSILGLSQRESLREIPISGPLTQATAGFLQNNAKGPLQ